MSPRELRDLATNAAGASLFASVAAFAVPAVRPDAGPVIVPLAFLFGLAITSRYGEARRKNFNLAQAVIGLAQLVGLGYALTQEPSAARMVAVGFAACAIALAATAWSLSKKLAPT